MATKLPMRRLWVLLLPMMFALLVAGCSAGSSQAPMAPQDGNVDSGGGAPYPEEGGGGEPVDRLVIRNKTLRLEVDDTAAAVGSVRDLARRHQAIVTDMQVATDDDGYVVREAGDGTGLRGWVTVRVPADDFEAFIDEVSKLGTVRFQAESSTDVTQEHVDMSARLENLRAEEKRLREFFDAAKDVKDMLAIETELNRVRGEIESLDAQVKYLERQAAMATVTVELVEPRPVVQTWGVGEAFADGIRGAVGLVNLLLTILVASSPLWVTALVLFFPIRAWIRRRRRSHAGAVMTPTPQWPPAPPAPTPAPTPSPGSESESDADAGAGRS